MLEVMYAATELAGQDRAGQDRRQSDKHTHSDD